MKVKAEKVVWITGASSGIGKALTYQYIEKGFKIIISSRKEEDLEKVKQLAAFPENIFVLPMDISKFDELEAKVQTAIHAFGTIDILINNAGVSQRSLIIDTNFEVYKSLILAQWRCLKRYYRSL